MLGHQHLDYLAAMGKQGSQGLRLGIRQGTGDRLNSLGEMDQDRSVEGISLGQAAASSGKVAHLAGIDYCYRQAGGQSAAHRQLILLVASSTTKATTMPCNRSRS